MANAPCATAGSATMPELIAAVGFCSLFNGCRVKAASTTQLLTQLLDTYWRNTRNSVGGYKFDFNHYRAGIIMDLPPSLYMHFQQAQEIQLAISKGQNFAAYTRSATYRRYVSANYYRMPYFLKQLTGAHVPTAQFFENVKRGLAHSRIRGMTEEDISMTALKLTSQQKTNLGNQMVTYGSRYGTSSLRKNQLASKWPRTRAEEAELSYLTKMVPIYQQQNLQFVYNYYACRFSFDHFLLTSRVNHVQAITLRQFTDAYNAANPEYVRFFTSGQIATFTAYRNAMFGSRGIQSIVASYPNRCIPSMRDVARDDARKGR